MRTTFKFQNGEKNNKFGEKKIRMSCLGASFSRRLREKERKLRGYSVWLIGLVIVVLS